MKIIQLPNKKLRKISLHVSLPLSIEDENVVKTMIKHIDDSQKKDSTLRSGIGIAAIQMGYLKRMFYVNVPKSEINEPFRDFLINPEFTAISDYEAALELGEGCLSINEKDDKEGLVHRKFKVVVRGYSYFKKEIVEYKKSGLLAIVLQHEMDHLNGKLYIDRIDDKNIWKSHPKEEII